MHFVYPYLFILIEAMGIIITGHCSLQGKIFLKQDLFQHFRANSVYVAHDFACRERMKRKCCFNRGFTIMFSEKLYEIESHKNLCSCQTEKKKGKTVIIRKD